MKCRDCKKEFVPNPHWHHKWGLCKKCSIINTRKIKAKYKKSTKGRLTELRWRKNPIKKEIDKKSRQTPRSKHLAVLRSQKQLKENKYAQESKKRTDRIYMSRTQGKLRNWWAEQSANGCMKCGSFTGLGVDHIIPKSKGGGDGIDNLQVLCRVCNGKKGNKIEN